MVRVGWLALIICVVAVPLLAQVVSAAATTCTLTADKSPASYHPGENILWTMKCTAGGDNNKNYVIEIYNSTGTNFVNLTGTNPADATNFFYQSWNIPVTYPVQNNSYGVFKDLPQTGNSTAYFNVSGAATNTYLIVSLSSTYNGSWFWDENNAIRAVVEDYRGNPVVGAQCKIDIYSSIDNSAFYTQDSAVSGSDGDILFNIYVDYNTFDLGTFKYEVNCQYVSSTLGDESNGSASGIGSGTFTVGSYVVNQSAYVYGNPSNVSTQTLQNGCVNFTNNYRSYTEDYDITGQLLCNVPLNTQVVNQKFTQTVGPGANVTYCLPLVVPEAASAGTGICKVVVGITPHGAADDMSSDFSATSSNITIIPVFAKIVGGTGGVKTSISSATAQLYMSTTIPAGGLIRVDFPDLIANSWGYDRLANVTLTYNGTTYLGNLTVGSVAPQDAGEMVSIQEGTLFARNIEYWFTLNVTIPANAVFNVTLNAYSEVSFWQSVQTYLSGIMVALQNLVIGSGKTVDTPTVGNYTNITSALTTGTVGSANLTVNYNITGGNATSRRVLHFVYQFAPVTSGTEGAFVDQNPSIEGYQALSVYQTVQLNQTKSFALTLSPNLPVGNYTMYGTVYELDNAPPVSGGSVVADERTVSQASYSIVVDQQMIPSFDGNVIQLTGVSMTSIS